jgi:hypothetical protein|nr:MAG TPA: hypothetical protein [Caudoviricetes sp.]
MLCKKFDKISKQYIIAVSIIYFSMNKQHEKDFDMIDAALLGAIISVVISDIFPVIVSYLINTFFPGFPPEKQPIASELISVTIGLTVYIWVFMRSENKKTLSIMVV